MSDVQTMQGEAARPGAKAVFAAGVVGGIAASIINTLVLIVGNILVAGTIHVKAPGAAAYERLHIINVVGACMTIAVAASFIMWLLAIITPKHAANAFTIAAVLFALSSLRSPIALDISTAQTALLVSMHVIAAVLITVPLVGVARRA